MKTTERKHETRVILKDGANYLATWSENFGKVPTIGERIAFPHHVGGLEHLGDFRSAGRVTKIQEGKGMRDSFMEVQAEPLRQFRRSVTLNSGFVPQSLRMNAERIVRQAMPEVRIVWEEAMEPSAVLRMADADDFPEGSLGDAQRSRGDACGRRETRPSRVSLEDQLRRMLSRSRETLAHF